jgi:tRNA-specific adenosine deaminase 1
MWKDIPKFSEQLVKTTLEKYAKLAKNGKPLLHANKAEWTVLASILLVHYGKHVHTMTQKLKIFIDIFLY